jgi:NADPH:quinone reductase-like Zn-dependent oxidoreductase
VLIHGPAGGVGGFAVQFARGRGTRVTATAGMGNLDFVRGLGADDVIDDRWDVSPVPSEASHENVPTLERNDGGFSPPFTHSHQESKSRAERHLGRR